MSPSQVPKEFKSWRKRVMKVDERKKIMCEEKTTSLTVLW